MNNISLPETHSGIICCNLFSWITSWHLYHTIGGFKIACFHEWHCASWISLISWRTFWYICHMFERCNIAYYIDRCELWGFIREINPGISQVRYQFREMLLTNLAHNQHDVIDVIWRLLVWNVKIIRYFGVVYASILIKFN